MLQQWDRAAYWVVTTHRYRPAVSFQLKQLKRCTSLNDMYAGMLGLYFLHAFQCDVRLKCLQELLFTVAYRLCITE